jgi:hypothetical protein
MRRAQALLLSLGVLFLNQLGLINSSAQTALVKTRDLTGNVARSSAVDVPLSNPASESKNPFEAPWLPMPSALSSQDPKKLGLIDRAYLDAFTILNDDNECSRLFGGRFAISALNEFVKRLKPTYLDRNVAIRMSGSTTSMQSNRTGFKFRVFDKAEINLTGSFFHNGPALLVSSFQANTRETRVLVLLHELGHMVKSPDDSWVLPDDGDDRSLSIENTQRVVSVCRRQIESLSKLTAEQQLKLAVKE